MANPTKKTERFQVIRTLAQDPLGRADLANDLQTQSKVIVRHFHSDLFDSPASAQQFVQRVKSAAAVKRDGFQKILALGITAGEPWVVCSGADQGTLRDAIVQNSLEPRFCVEQFTQLAEKLDLLHADGLVHGGIRPETLVFEKDGALSLGEYSTLHSLFHWQPGMCQFPQEVLGTLIDPATISPEAAQSAAMDGKSDQYALARALKSALSASYGDVQKIPPVVSRALNSAMTANPRERFTSCKALMQAVAAGIGSPTKELVKRIAIVAAPIAAMGIAYAMGSWIGDKASASETEVRQKKQIDDYLKPFQAAPAKVQSVSRDVLIANADDRGASLFEGFVGRRESVREAGLRKQLEQLQNLSRLKLDLDFSGKAAFTPEAAQPVAILVSGFGPPRLGDARSPIDYTLKVQSPAINQPTVDFRVILRFTDSQGASLAPDQVLKFDIRQSDQTLQGKLPVPAGGWKAGMQPQVEAILAAEGVESPWQKFPRPAIATFGWTTSNVKVAPETVKAHQADGFALPTDFDLQEGDFFKAAASGKIQPATEANYKILQIDNVASGPDGVEIKVEKNIRNYEIVNNKLPWGALLWRTGVKGDWQLLPPAAIQFADIKKTGGKVFLSINSAISQNGKPLPPGDNRWWQANGAFDLTMSRGRLETPADVPLLAAARARLLRRLAILCGAANESSLSAPYSITGDWESPDGTKVAIVDSGSRIAISLSASTELRALELQFDRDQEDLLARKGEIGFRSDKSSTTFETDSQLFIADVDHLTLINEAFRFDNGELGRRQPSGQQLQLTRVKPKPVPSGNKPKTDEAAGLLALNLSGFWRAEDQATTFNIKDDGKQLKVTMSQSDRFKDFNGTVNKSEDKFTVVSWRVTRAATAVLPEQQFSLKCRISLKDPNTLVVEMDGLRFNPQTGELMEIVDFGIKSNWYKQSNIQNPFRFPQRPNGF